jgi:hypothetical protein
MSWIRYQCVDAPESRGGHSAVVLGRKHVVIFGGNADPRRQTQAADANGARRGCILRDARVLDSGFLDGQISLLFITKAYDCASIPLLFHSIRRGFGWIATRRSPVIILCLGLALGLMNSYLTKRQYALSSRGKDRVCLSCFAYLSLLNATSLAATMTWASLEAVGQIPTARYAHAASPLGDAMMVIHGGHDGEKWLDDLVVLEIGLADIMQYPLL